MSELLAYTSVRMAIFTGASPILTAFGGLLLANITGAMVTWLVARLLGIRPTKVQLFSSPVVARRKCGPTEWTIGAVPFGAHVVLPGMSPFDEQSPTGDERQFWQLSRLAQVAIVTIYPVALAAVAACLIGANSALSALCSGLWQLPWGAVQPFSLGRHLVLQWRELVVRGDFQLALGILFAKFAAMELLPVGSAHSLRALWCIAGWVQRRWTAYAQVLALVVGLLGFIVWVGVVVWVTFDSILARLP